MNVAASRYIDSKKDKWREFENALGRRFVTYEYDNVSMFRVN